LFCELIGSLTSLGGNLAGQQRAGLEGRDFSRAALGGGNTH